MIRLGGGMAAFVVALAGASAAPAERELAGDIGGDVKALSIGVFPYTAAFLPKNAFGHSALDLRLKLDGSYGRLVRVVAHQQVTAVTESDGSPLGLGPAFTGAGEAQPQAVDLSWSADTTAGFGINGRMDRLMVLVRAGNVDLTLGRQPITFGTTFFFTPMDLVAPFFPTDVDREYKPGVDAVRIDGFFGTSGQITAVATYAGGWDVAGTVLAAHGGMTLAVWDVGLFVASARDDWVVGADTAGSIGAWAVRGEATLTLPSEDRGDPFVRAVLGLDRRFESGLSWVSEVYVQSLGARRPAGYLRIAQSRRVSRGEIWALGRYYLATSLDYELLPILRLNGFAVANLADPSALVGLGVSWSVADNAAVDAGAYLGAGERPSGTFQHPMLGALPRARSEFGLVPSALYVLLSAYF